MEISWETFLSKLERPLRTGESFAEYQRLPKAEKAKKKEAAGGFVGGAVNGGRRVAGAVEQRWLVTLDADDATAEDWDNAVAINEFAFAAYSTHSHCPAKPRLRWVVPLRRAVSRDEYAAVARQVEPAQDGVHLPAGKTGEDILYNIPSTGVTAGVHHHQALVRLGHQGLLVVHGVGDEVEAGQ